uniref:Ig-like domain-containing protein n=1 Tax=Xiphophorus maculatus TaxID=8083 RepID=A0A3B5QGX8_XIPMA
MLDLHPVRGNVLRAAAVCPTHLVLCCLSVLQVETNITAEVGQETFLPCRSPDNKPVIAVEWIRSDLGSEYVLLYRNKKINLENQHVMFKDRVDLQDRQMKDGNVSLVLKNVTTDDGGAYECRIIQTNSWMEIVFAIYLDVLNPPGELMFHPVCIDTYCGP